MARMIDVRPSYKGEGKVWDSIQANLPDEIIVYNNREVRGREFDFCLVVEGSGFLVVEVKGWLYDKIKVENVDQIVVEGYEKTQQSPKKQARVYRWHILETIRKKFDANPLVIDMVCYPFITQAQYMIAGLDIVSDPYLTIFKEDLENASLLQDKIRYAFMSSKKIPHDELTDALIVQFRRGWEPSFRAKTERNTELVRPYSILTAYCSSLSDEDINRIVDDYFSGTKRIVFVSMQKDYQSILQALDEAFRTHNIGNQSGALSIGYIPISVNGDNEFRAFNIELYCLENLGEIVGDSFVIEEGECTTDQKKKLESLSSETSFNVQQYFVEHSPTDENVLVAAGAGTGKTYSMVSRVAFLCNKHSDPVLSLLDDVAMMTFTNDAAANMKTRLKQMFVSYFILTGNPRQLRLADEVDQAHISTIHSFAIGFMRNEVLYTGLGTNYRITSNAILRDDFYDEYLSEYLDVKVRENSEFSNEMPVQLWEIKKKLIEVADKLLAKSIDLNEITPPQMGVSESNYIPYFNELIENVLIPAEMAYGESLRQYNDMDLRDAIIKLESVLKKHRGSKINSLKFRYMFIDEFQDTDDVQIKMFSLLQKLVSSDCRFFIVGDIKQSIYRFRGATLSAFDSMCAQSLYDWRKHSLTVNYRTDKRLLEKYHEVFLPMGSEGYLPYDTAHDRLISHVVSDLDDDNLFVCVPCHSKDDRVFGEEFIEMLNTQIAALKQAMKDRESSGFAPLSSAERTIAILVRSNWQVENLVSMARRNGIYIETKTGGDLFQLESTLDMYKLVSALVNSSDLVCLVNLIESNFIELNLDYRRYRSATDEECLNDLTRILDEFFKVRMGKTWHQVVSDAYTQPVLFVIKQIYDALQPWKQYSEKYREQRQYLINQEFLLEKIIEYARIDSLTLNVVEAFLRINILTKQERQSRQLPNDDKGITVLCTTVHKSKGLEYGTVILPYTNWELQASNRLKTDASYSEGKLSYVVVFEDNAFEYNTNFSMDDETIEHMREESRILYVALTRAIRNCVWMKDLDKKLKLSWGTLLEARNAD